MNNSPLLHVYGQHSEHDEVWIVGTKEALRRLIVILSKATSPDKEYRDGNILFLPSPPFMTSDGEGYDVHIVCNDTEWQGEYWKNLRLPYTGSASEDHREGAKWPWEGK